MEKLNINSIEISRNEASEIIKVLEDQRNLSDGSKKVLEYLKRAVKVPLLDEVEGIPKWALYYLEYGEDDSLEEDERAMIDEFLEDNHYRFSSVKDGDEDDDAFDRYPQFGKACNTCTCYFEVLPECWRDQIEPDDVDDWVDRIERVIALERIELREDEAKMLLREYAAAPDESLTPTALELKRELLRLAPAPGNAAAMRDALAFFVHDFASFREDVEHGRLHMMQCMDFAKEFIPFMEAALAAPPRNCDRFDDEQDAQLAFLNEEWLISVDKDSMLERDKFENWTDEMRSAYARWLMAKAEGKEEDSND